jgi:hypothetical protein
MNSIIKPKLDVIECILTEFSSHLKLHSSSRSKLILTIQISYNDIITTATKYCN